MAKSGARSQGGASRASEPTRARMIEAAIQTLKERGFAGASARAIAETGTFSQALVFYHFGSVNGLLLAALDATSDLRMRRYTAALEGGNSLPELMRVAAAVYREDLVSGHIQVLAELIAGASTSPELGPEIVKRVQPWIRFTEDAVGKVVAGTPLDPLVPRSSLAFAIVSLYLGAELLTHLQADPSRADELFDTGIRLTGLIGMLLAPGPQASGPEGHES